MPPDSLEAIPNFLSHYYEAAIGPFVNLSDLPINEAETQLELIRQFSEIFASRRSADYVTIRRELEDRVRSLFIQKGGQLKRKPPHYMILGACPWGFSWYTDGRELRIPLASFPPESISFTYGDTFPAMRVQDGKPYRGQVYTLEEIPQLVLQFDLPQIWDDEPLKEYSQIKG